MLFGSKSAKIENLIQKKKSAKLVALLNDKQAEIRLQAIRGLGSIGDEKSVNALIGLLYDPDENIRKETIKTMGDMNNQTIKSHLQHMSLTEQDITMKILIDSSLRKIPQKY